MNGPKLDGIAMYLSEHLLLNLRLPISPSHCIFAIVCTCAYIHHLIGAKPQSLVPVGSVVGMYGALDGCRTAIGRPNGISSIRSTITAYGLFL